MPQINFPQIKAFPRPVVYQRVHEMRRGGAQDNTNKAKAYIASHVPPADFTSHESTAEEEVAVNLMKL